MNSLVYYTIRSGDSKQINTSIKLNSCTENTEDDEWNDDWYQNAYEYTCVDTSFEEVYKRDGEGYFTNDTANWKFYLVRESNEDNWFIVMMTSP